MAFTRDQLEAYEKKPQTQVSDKQMVANFMKGATPARAADPAAVAAVAAGQVDATPGGAPARQAVADSDPLTDDSPIVDEDGTLGDPTDSGEGTSDENSADSSAAAVDPADDADPNADLTGDPAAEEEAVARPVPKKGSAQERIVEALDLAEGYKVFGQHMQDQLKEALTENARLRGGGTPAPTATTPAAPPVVEAEDPMPALNDADVAFDDDKYRAKMQNWVDRRTEAVAKRVLRQATGADAAQKVRDSVEAKVTAFAQEHPDFEKVVKMNPVLAQNQLAPDAGLAVGQSEYTAELLYAFGKDPGMAIRVARQSPAQQLLTIGKMIAKIEAEKESSKGAAPAGKGNPQGGAKPAQKKSITQAPPPPRATPAGGRTQSFDPLDPNVSIDEFARQHRQGKQSTREQNRKQRGLS
jgi:hypothetical protein